MKKLLIILLLASLSAKAQYHINVECFWNPGGQYDGNTYSTYIVVFTNDNWKTKSPIYETFDSSDKDKPIHVIYQEKLFMDMGSSQDDAVFFAKRFKNFKQCVDYNLKQRQIYSQLLNFRKLHPVKPPVRFLPKERCCTTTKIY